MASAVFVVFDFVVWKRAVWTTCWCILSRRRKCGCKWENCHLFDATFL